jgi:NADPH2:quinone reductase
MRAAFYEKNGSARDVLKVGEVDTPRPVAGEVRVKLATSGVNPSDVKTRAGTTRKIAFSRVIPHSDGAGIIDAVGDGVATARIGERVWLWNGQWKRPFGTCAEYIAVPAAQAVPLPDQTSFAEGACLGIPALTGFHAVALAGAGSGATLLVSGGAGSVSQYAIQFAKARGATIIATVSSPEKAKVAREAGADHTIDYKRANVGERVMEITGKRGVDAVIEMDLTANAAFIPAVLRARGRVIVYGTGSQATLPALFLLVNSVTLQFFLVYELTADERAAAISGITRMLETQRLHNRVGPIFPLAEVAAAHEAVEGGKTVGNVLVRLG